MNKRSFAILEKAFMVEIEAAVNGGIGLLQTKSQLAELLEMDGYLIKDEKVIPGRFPVRVKGYRLTVLGNMTYCLNCGDSA